MSENNVLVIGSGGREHAICWKLADSPLVNKVYCAPGNVGMSTTDKVETVEIDVKDCLTIAKLCKEHLIDLVVIGPEEALADGIVDNLTSLGIKCFGPIKAGAQIEANKVWAKTFMERYRIPIPKYKSFTDADAAKDFIRNAPFPALVVKASGLTASKGVVVASTKEKACEAVDEILTERKYGAAGETVVIEELLEGDEVSVLCFTDGDTISLMLPIQDYKRIGEGDTGPNTGGMGAYCPCPFITPGHLTFVKEVVLGRAITALKSEGIKYVGILYAGIIITKFGPVVLEFNCHFGDPEAQVLLPLLKSDLYTIMKSCINGTLKDIEITWNMDLYSVGVVLASEGYPETCTKGCVINGLSQVESNPDVMVFYSGVNRDANGELVTWGGRVLLVCVQSEFITNAIQAAMTAASMIKFPGAQYRKDIARKMYIQDIYLVLLY